MQFGHTIPLQRRLGVRGLPPPAAQDLAFCWDLHRVHLAGREGLLGVNASSRLAFFCWGLGPGQWGNLPAFALGQVGRLLRSVGVPPAAVERYLALAGPPVCTRTHGRRPVAFLNRAVDALFATGVQPDPADLPQPLLEEALNSGCCRAAGFPEKGRPRDFFRADLARLLGGPADGREGERPYVGVD